MSVNIKKGLENAFVMRYTYYTNDPIKYYRCFLENHDYQRFFERFSGLCGNVPFVQQQNGVCFYIGVIAVSEKKDEKYISLEDAAEYLNIKPVTLRRWIKQKDDLPAHQIGRLWKFKKSELDAWVNSGKSATK